MSLAYLAIDKDVSIHDREKIKWNKRGVLDVRVDSLTEGIEKAVDNQFLYIVINADNIHYMPGLDVLRDVTKDPIIIGTSNFSVKKQIEAIHTGANFYGKFSSSQENMELALSVIKRADDQAKRKPKILTHGGIFLAPAYHKAFVDEVEIRLSKIEMDILVYLINNRGRILTHSQIFRQIYNGDYDEASSDVIYGTMKRLRSKLRNASGQHDYIENIRDVGYRLTTKYDTSP